MNIKLGFSTGTLFKHQSTREALLTFSNAGISGVELGYVKELDESWMQNATAEDLKQFEYVSLHAPKHEYADDESSWNILRTIKNFHDNVRKLDIVVFHPDPIKDFSVLNKAGIPVGIENMDNRKETHQTPSELAEIMDKFPNFKIILDVNHIFSNDPSMGLASEFFDLLGDKIAQIHLSGYAGYHEPLFETKQESIFRSIKDLNIPIIVESVMHPEDVQKEKDYILSLVRA